MSSRTLVLVAEDDPSLARVARHELSEAGYEVLLARTGDEALALFRQHRPAAVLTDVRMPGISGLELTERVLAEMPGTPVVIMTGFGEVRDAVAALKRGAADYLVKPVDWDEVLLVLGRALERERLASENERLRKELARQARFERLVGESPPMQALFESLARLVEVDTTVLIEGDSGTGKELVARALHYQSHRARGPFVAINCAALPRELIEAQLFGHERGAFTGAVRDAAGAFEQAEGGTLFLDEVAEIPLAGQSALLRALAERSVQRVGSSTWRRVDVRVIAATNRDLLAAIAEREFREDLYFRLAVVPLRLPRLRERGRDVLEIAAHVLEELGAKDVRLEPEVEERFLDYAWPGNVRELRNVLERACVLRRDPGCIRLADLPEALREPSGPLDAVFLGRFPPGGVDLVQLERECIRRALRASVGNQTRAAQLLGITRQTLIYRMQKHGLRG